MQSPALKEVSPRVVALFRKARRGQPMVPVKDALSLRAGQGIEGDVNQHPMSPRQVLLTRWEDLRDFEIVPGALRENIVIEGLDIHRFAPGSVLWFAGGVGIRLTFHCEPCKRIAHLVPHLREIINRRGILGVVLRDGSIQVGERVEAEPRLFEALSSVPYERFLFLAVRIPQGRVLTYKDVLAGMGVAESYFRAIPNYLKRAGSHYPVHRIVDSTGSLIPYVANQRKLLEQEGVVITTDSMFDTGSRAAIFSDRSLFEVEDFLPSLLPRGLTQPEQTRATGRVDLLRYRWLDPTLFTRR